MNFIRITLIYTLKDESKINIKIIIKQTNYDHDLIRTNKLPKLIKYLNRNVILLLSNMTWM